MKNFWMKKRGGEMHWQEAIAKSNMQLAYRIQHDINGNYKIIRNIFGIAYRINPTSLTPVERGKIEGFMDWEPFNDIREDARQKYRTGVDALKTDKNEIDRLLLLNSIVKVEY